MYDLECFDCFDREMTDFPPFQSLINNKYQYAIPTCKALDLCLLNFDLPRSRRDEISLIYDMSVSCRIFSYCVCGSGYNFLENYFAVLTGVFHWVTHYQKYMKMLLDVRRKY